MTDAPSIAAQIAYVGADIREPQEDWCAAECEFDAMQRAILATLQQHERATAEVEWLRRLLRWCRPRLKHASYQTWLDMYLALGTSPPPADQPPIVQSAALDAANPSKSPLR